MQADLRDPHSVRAALDGADAAVNAVSLYVESRDATFQAIHVEGAGQLARAAADAGLDRLVHISGIGADARSTSAYIRARGEGEDAVRAGFPGATILRPSVMFGPDDAFLTTLVGLVRAAADRAALRRRKHAAAAGACRGRRGGGRDPC